MPVGLLWYVKVGGLTVCLLNLANKRHPAKPLWPPSCLCFLCPIGEEPMEGSGGEGRGCGISFWVVADAQCLSRVYLEDVDENPLDSKNPTGVVCFS